MGKIKDDIMALEHSVIAQYSEEYSDKVDSTLAGYDLYGSTRALEILSKAIVKYFMREHGMTRKSVCRMMKDVLSIIGHPSIDDHDRVVFGIDDLAATTEILFNSKIYE